MKFLSSSIIICLIFVFQNNLLAQGKAKADYHTTKSFPIADSIESKIYKDSTVVPSTPLVVLSEIGLGSLLAIASTGLVGGVASHVKIDDYTYAILLAYLAYSFGHSLGVYIVSKKNNSATSFLELFAVSALSAAVSAYAFLESDQIGAESLFPLLMPLIAPIIYTNIVYPVQLQKIRVEVTPSLSVKENSLQYGMNF